jgi:copper chaperone CopZ
MTATFEHARPSACPACNAAPAAEHLAELPKDATLMLSLPGIHCAGCISGVEKALNAVPGVRSARVNLTLRRAAVEAGPEVTAEDLTAVLDRAGYEAHELDAGVLATTEADRQGKDLLMRLAVAFFAMMNVMLLSVAVWSGAEGVTRDMMHWISAAIAAPGGRVLGSALLRLGLGRAQGRAAQHGRADHAGDRAGGGHVAVRNDDVGAPRLFRCGDHAVLLPAGRALSRSPHAGLCALGGAGTGRAGGAARAARDGSGRGDRRGGGACRGRYRAGETGRAHPGRRDRDGGAVGARPLADDGREPAGLCRAGDGGQRR